MTRPTIAVIGAGTMGRGIVQVLCEAGFSVLLHDAVPGSAAKAVDFVAGMFARAVDKGRMSSGARDAALARLTVAERFADIADAQIVIEAIFEDLEAKRALIAALDAVVSSDAVIASNTSSLSITAIARGSKDASRVAGLHFFNPVPLMPVAEVIRAVDTRADVVDRLKSLVEAIGHAPILCGDTPGFVINHAGRGLNTEGLRIIQEGVTDTTTVDRLMREAAGFRMGPFELLDLTGLDVSHAVMRKIYDQYYQEPRFRPSPLAELQVQAGHFGRKTGRGFYPYPDGQMEVPQEQPVPSLDPARDIRLWLDSSPLSDAAYLDTLRAALGDVIEPGAAASPGSVVVMAPTGHDATEAALAAGHPPSRTVAVDPLFSPSRRLTLMTSPATSPETADTAHALLARAGFAVSRIGDSPGFVVQRIVATIVNIACDIAQQKIASPDDIDRAVMLGLGYPKGPLALGNLLGPQRLLAILDRILARTGDPRYRASLWLRRRAELGISLLTPGS